MRSDETVSQHGQGPARSPGGLPPQRHPSLHPQNRQAFLTPLICILWASPPLDSVLPEGRGLLSPKAWPRHEQVASEQPWKEGGGQWSG